MSTYHESALSACAEKQAPALQDLTYKTQSPHPCLKIWWLGSCCCCVAAQFQLCNLSVFSRNGIVNKERLYFVLGWGVWTTRISHDEFLWALPEDLHWRSNHQVKGKLAQVCRLVISDCYFLPSLYVQVYKILAERLGINDESVLLTIYIRKM